MLATLGMEGGEPGGSQPGARLWMGGGRRGRISRRRVPGLSLQCSDCLAHCSWRKTVSYAGR